MLKVGISGGPHSGKTTTLEALKIVAPKITPNSYFVDEAAVEVMKEEKEKAKNDSEYQAITPGVDYPAFQPIVLAKQLELEEAIPKDTTLAISDRTLVDHIGYCRLNGLEERVSEIEERIAVANYGFAFFCEPVGEYKQTPFRHETPEEAKVAHDAISQAYDASDVPTIHLPAVSLEDRVEIITEHITQALTRREA